MKEITFLGMSEAALSMFFEILHVIYQSNFSAHIIQNLTDPNEGGRPFKIKGVESWVSQVSEWQYQGNEHLVMGVNLSENKRAVCSAFKSLCGIEVTDYQRLIHPNSTLSQTTELSPGVILNPGVVLAPFSVLKELVTVNRCVSIGHHSTVHKFSTIHPGVNIAGNCSIGSDVTIGMGSNIVDGVSIGNNTIIGAGSLVTSDIPENVVAYGAPAKIVKQRKARQ